jgi:hypothetical protein
MRTESGGYRSDHLRTLAQRVEVSNQSLSAIEPVCGTQNGNWKMATRDLRPKTADPGHETGSIGVRDSRTSA